MSSINSNSELIFFITESLKTLGVKEVVICAGSRNAPLALYLAQLKTFTLHSYFEERAAGFFALGRAQNTARPVAILTTSGTASATLLPSLIEAHYSQVPLIALTADRPKRYRGSGAPQSIEQTQLFGTYVEKSFDWDSVPENLELEWSLKSPLHFNMCFDEPLAVPTLTNIKSTQKMWLSNAETVSPAGKTNKEFFKKLASFEKTLVIVSKIAPEHRHRCIDFLLRYRAPIFLESTSNLREEPALQPLRIKSSERILSFESWDGVLKIGGVPHLRFWRDLEEKFANIPLLSLDEGPFSGSPRAEHLKSNLEILDEYALAPLKHDFKKIFELDKWCQEQKQELFLKFPYSEPALVHKLSRLIDHNSLLYLGNSLPIREWELCADFKDKGRSVAANRGANGIDGQLATFFGLCTAGRPNWALLGDITFLYDLSSLSLKEQLARDVEFQICVVNNKGGRIFSRLPQYKDSELETHRRRFLETEHSLEFSPLAQMYSLAYEKWDGKNPFASPGPQSLIEITPDPDETLEFWREFEGIWRTQ